MLKHESSAGMRKCTGPGAWEESGAEAETFVTEAVRCFLSPPIQRAGGQRHMCSTRTRDFCAG